MRKILSGTLVSGEPLKFDYYDADGTLLLRRGHVLINQQQVDELVERGLFEQPVDNIPKSRSATVPVAALTNPFDLLNRCKNRLVPMLNQLRIDNPDQEVPLSGLAELTHEYRMNVKARCSDANSVDCFPDGVPLRVLEIAKVIQKVCRLDADAALGYVHLTVDERYTAMHPLHCAILAEILGSALGLSMEVRQATIAATLTANISILSLQEKLHRQEQALSEMQHQLLRLHPFLSCEMLREVGVTNEVWLNAVLAHHERFDGSGYPSGLSGDSIAISARIVAMTDIYDAMIKPRGHRKALGSREALREIFMNRGAKVDEPMAKTLIKELGIYPPGSFVRLHNGEIAVVFRRGHGATAPLVRSVIGPRGAVLDHPIRRNTSETHYVVMDSAERDPMIRVVLDHLWDYA